jgi:ribosomal protein L3 glutamine methyltransferase
MLPPLFLKGGKNQSPTQLMPTSPLSELLTFRDMVRFGASQFNAADMYFGHGNTNAWDEALCIVRHVLHLSPAEDKYVADARLLETERAQIAALFTRRIQERKPAAYLTQEAWFADLSFYVDERVLIPRSPIAEFIRQDFSPWLPQTPITHILDMCTGSACIAIACALQFPEAQVDAVDISSDALAVAQINVSHHQVGDSVHLIQSDLFAALPQKTYDIIVCNPPYVDAEDMATLPQEYQHEPKLALAGGEDGLDLVARILKEAPAYLAPEGILMVEVGNSALAAEARFSQYPLTWLACEHGGHGIFLLKKKELL